VRPLVACAAFALIAAPAAAQRYAAGSATCDGWPRAPLEMADGVCAGIVVAPPPTFAARTLKFPRNLLPLPGGREWLVADMGGWLNGQGRILRLSAERGKPVEFEQLLTALNMPHGLARGPDGKIYVGEMSRIFRFDPDARSPQATIEAIITGLPDNRLYPTRHPLTNFIFDSDGALLVSVGATSDQCGSRADGPNGDRLCSESEGAEPTAGIRRYAYLGNGRWSATFTTVARGLRNALAMVRHASGTILLADNGIDFPDPHRPYDELNVLRAGAHYGWPYCVDMDAASPVWGPARAMECGSPAHEKPVRLLPPHSAPLAMTYYDGTMFPQFRGRLLMTWHGYRPTGARLVAFDVDGNGIPVARTRARYAEYQPSGGVMTPYAGPASEPMLVVSGWDRRKDVRPMGAPVGVAVANDGAIWIAEDRNATILRIAPERP
jgi:glucose/arabinose dehydrogenase